MTSELNSVMSMFDRDANGNVLVPVRVVTAMLRQSRDSLDTRQMEQLAHLLEKEGVSRAEIYGSAERPQAAERESCSRGRRICYRCRLSGHLAADCTNWSVNFAARKAEEDKENHTCSLPSTPRPPHTCAVPSKPTATKSVEDDVGKAGEMRRRARGPGRRVLQRRA